LPVFHIVALHLVSIVRAIVQELHIAFGTGRVSATLDAAVVAHAAYWRARGVPLDETRRLTAKLLVEAGYPLCAPRWDNEVPRADIAADVMGTCARVYDASWEDDAGARLNAPDRYAEWRWAVGL
jgi:hypothetical protein